MNVIVTLLALSVFHFHLAEKHDWKEYEFAGFFCFVMAIVLNILNSLKII